MHAPPRGTPALIPTGRLVFALLAFLPVCARSGASPFIESVEFQPPSRRAGETRFTSLPPEETGIGTENRYDDPDMWGERYPIFALGSTGTGVAIADYDDDGRPDIYVVNKSDPNVLFRNMGDWRFEDVTGQAGVRELTNAWKQAAAFADVNNDGRLDLYVTRNGAPNLLHVNLGDGRFVERAAAAGVAVADGSGMACFCDYDRDGWLDFYLQTSLLDPLTHPQGQRDRLFHNRRDGTFEDVTDRAGIYGETHGHSATWWDFNNDDWPDLYVANDFSAPDQLYRNDGNGRFTDVITRTVPHMPLFAMGADLGDVNNDGLIDFFVADMAPTTRTKDHRTMIEFRRLIPDPPDPELPPQVVRNALYLNTGLDRCLEAASLAGLAATDWTWSVRFEDLDNDGRLDVHVTNGMVRDFFDSDLRVGVERWPLAERARAIKATPVLAERNFAFRNRGDLEFESTEAAWGLDHEGVSFGAAFGDLDGDGDLDLVFVNYQGAPTVCRNDTEDGRSIIVAFRGTESNRFGVGAKVRIDTAAGTQMRQLVLARGYMSSSEPVIHFGLGAERVVRRLTITWPSGRVQSYENLPTGHRYTITEETNPGQRVPAAPSQSTSGQFEEIGEQLGLILQSNEPAVAELRLEPLLPFRQNPFGPGVALGDLNGDGRDDLVLGGARDQAPQFALDAGNGTFVPQQPPPRKGAADAAPLVFDANGDGANDLLLAKGGVALPADNPGYQPVLLLNQGEGKFRQAPDGSLPTFTASAGPAVAADFNRDGRLDVFIGGRVVPGDYGTTPRSALWINYDGRFSDETTSLAPGLDRAGMVSAALATDVDQDGWIDLLVATQWGEVQYWRNCDGQCLENRSHESGFASAGTGWWNSLATADFNGDGRLDYVVGNAGLNTPYRASIAQPTLLFCGASESNGRPQLFEAMFDADVVVPRRGRFTMVGALPSLARKFPTFSSYASASLAAILGEATLRQSLRLQVTELRSGVFLSARDATHHFVPLPRLAQIAPIHGIVAGDFDGDGRADICATQNSHAPIPETGRFDGGLGQFLRGNGKGGFDPVPVRESRLVIPGDGKALAVFDADGDSWPDLVATRNNNRVLVFRNLGSDGGHAFSVTLRGPSGNRHAIGARIMVVMTDGDTQSAEAGAGGGYLSQSSATCFFGYRSENPPREIQVWWPDGTHATHPWKAATHHLHLAAPES